MVGQPVWRLSQISAPTFTVIPTDHAATPPSGIETPVWASAQA